MRKNGQKITDEVRYMAGVMHAHMDGTHISRYKWIAKKIGKIHFKTIERIIKAHLDNEKTNRPTPEGEGYQGRSG